MKFTKIQLGPEERKRLLEMIAEEEKRLDMDELTDEELAEEEHRLSEDLKRILANKIKESEESEKQALPADSVQEKAGDQVAAHTDIKLLRQQGPAKSPSSTQRRQISILLAAAVALFVVFQLASDYLQPQQSEFTHKGSGAANFVIENMICDYRLLWHSKAGVTAVHEAKLSDDRFTYLVEANEPLQVASKCLSHDVYAHAVFEANGSVTSVVYNQKIIASQWNLIPLKANEQWSLQDGEGRILLFMTGQQLDESIQLPQEFVSVLGEEPIVEFQEFNLKLEVL